MKRSLVALWLILGAVVWNAVFDLVTTRGISEYLYREAAHELGRGGPVAMREFMEQTVADAAIKASIWAVVIAGAGVFTVVALSRAQRPSTKHEALSTKP